MPHLSPLNWFSIAIFFYMCVYTIFSLIWWHQPILIQPMKGDKSKETLWNW
uniref:ATP synthase F0 subunit 8 n=1 Tax=Siboglinum plumosum TaxID=3080496 RepID=A0AA96WNF4_9ANNE|nr:ATP synthase F0 subunit 8 [Siboglinum plumosum]WNZ34614.1 ATP synthase F0 subunit 8 [Siboglinum plumosum]